MDQILFCALLSRGSLGTRGGSGPLGVSSQGRTPSPPPDTTLQSTASPSRPFDCSLHGQPLGDWLLFRSNKTQEEPNFSHDEWIHNFDVAWSVVLILLFLVVALLLVYIFCGPCLKERITSCTEWFWARMNILLRIFNQNSGNDYGAFASRETQSSPAADTRDSAAFEDAGAEYSETTETTEVHWERTDSEITLEAEDTV